MAVDWSINSGWFIISIIASIATIVLAGLKSWEVIRNARKDKREEQIKESQIRKKKNSKEY